MMDLGQYHYHLCSYPEGISVTTGVDRFLNGKWIITHARTGQVVAWLDGSLTEDAVIQVTRAFSATAIP